MATAKNLAEIKKMIAAKEGVKRVKTTWIMRPRPITWANGARGITGMIRVEAPGFHATKFHYTEMGNVWSVRPLGHC